MASILWDRDLWSLAHKMNTFVRYSAFCKTVASQAGGSALEGGCWSGGWCCFGWDLEQWPWWLWWCSYFLACSLCRSCQIAPCVSLWLVTHTPHTSTSSTSTVHVLWVSYTTTNSCLRWKEISPSEVEGAVSGLMSNIRQKHSHLLPDNYWYCPLPIG